MPIPLKPLRPEDGPTARFALALRALRDAAGAQNPALFSVDTVSRTTGISRQTIYAALGGRIPNRATLVALAKVWGGDPTEWVHRKTATENEIQLGSMPADGPADPRGKRDRSDPREVARWKARNSARAAATKEQTWKPLSLGSAATQASPIAQEFARRLDNFRRESGVSLRELTRRAGKGDPWRGVAKDQLPTATLSYVLRGMRFADWYLVERIVETLEGNKDEWGTMWKEMADQVGVRIPWYSEREDLDEEDEEDGDSDHL